MSGVISKLKSKPKLIEGDDQVRAKKCMQAVQEICDQYDCVIVPQTIITGSQIQWDIGVFPKPRQPEKPTEPTIQ